METYRDYWNKKYGLKKSDANVLDNGVEQQPKASESKHRKWCKPVRRPLGFVLSDEPSYEKWAAEHPEEVAKFEMDLKMRKLGGGGIAESIGISVDEIRRRVRNIMRRRRPELADATDAELDKAAEEEYARIREVEDGIMPKPEATTDMQEDVDVEGIPEGMKKKFPLGKWVAYPHARMTGKVRKIVGWYEGGKRDNGKTWYGCWLESPDIEEGCRGKVTGIAMYGGLGDDDRPIFDTYDEAKAWLDQQEISFGHRAQEALLSNRGE